MQTDVVNTLLSEITSKVEENLSNWYGNNATLVHPPEFQPRNWSVFIRYKVNTVDNGQKAILVKIRRLRDSELMDSINNEGLRHEGREDFEALKTIEGLFGENGTLESVKGVYSTVRPLAFFEESSALVMEELDARPLRKKFMKIKTAFNAEWQEHIVTLLNSAGRWLRIYHEQLGNRQDGPFFDNSIREIMEKNLQTIETTSRLDFSALRKTLDTAQNELKDATLTHGLLHRDFNCANVLVSQDGRIGVLDFHFVRGPIYIDIAKILTDIQTYSLQAFSQGTFINSKLMKRFHQSVLSGYFGDEELNAKALNLYSVFAILEKWEADEEKLLEGTDKFHIRALAPFRRNYYMRLVNSYAAKLVTDI